MSTKDWAVFEDNYGIYQEIDFGVDALNQNAACIQVDNPSDFQINHDTNVDGKVISQLIVEIPADTMDKLALGWLEKRKINAHEITYTIEELLKGHKSETLEYDNIFDAITDDKEKAKEMQKASNAAIKQRDVSELKGLLADSQHRKVSAARGILAHIKSKQDISDEESLLEHIQRALDESPEEE